MKKNIRFLSVILVALIFLTSCGSATPVDIANYNFNQDGVAFVDEEGNEVSREIHVSKNKTAEVYFDITTGMQEIAADGRFKKLLLDSVDAIGKTWLDVSTDVYCVGEGSSIEKKDISVINNLDVSMFTGTDNDVVLQALNAAPNKSNEKVIVPKIKLIITDLKNQLGNYQKLATTISETVMDAGQSMAFMSFNTTKPYYMFVIGAERDLSDYLDELYAMPDVSSFVGYVDKRAMDMDRPVNCIIYAQSSGIMGIDYENVEQIEKGKLHKPTEFDVVVPPPLPDGTIAPPVGEMTIDPSMQMPEGMGVPPLPGGAAVPPPPGVAIDPSMQAPGEMVAPPPPIPDANKTDSEPSEDQKGSFTTRRYDYTEKMMKEIIEGNVNFGIDESLQNVNEDDPWVEIGHPTGVSEEDINVEDIKYIAYKSLIWSGSEEAEAAGSTAGKMKVSIPFDVMSQVKLSTLLFDITTKVYTANEGDTEFYEATKKESECFEVACAEGLTLSMGRYRIDDLTNTAVLNIFVPDLNELPPYSKLDIKFTAYPEEAMIPVWVNNKTHAGYDNLRKFVSLLNDYQAQNNKFEGTLTCYVLAGDKEIYEDEDNGIKTENVADMK